MAAKGILVDYEWCSGCHACEIACQMEHGFEPDRYGIKIIEVGPWEVSEDRWQHANIPVFTIQCDLCESRVAEGKLPTCVHHCQASCLSYGMLDEKQDELSKKTQQMLFSLG